MKAQDCNPTRGTARTLLRNAGRQSIDVSAMSSFLIKEDAVAMSLSMIWALCSSPADAGEHS